MLALAVSGNDGPWAQMCSAAEVIPEVLSAGSNPSIQGNSSSSQCDSGTASLCPSNPLLLIIIG